MNSHTFYFGGTHFSASRQRGVMLIEALCAILIFSFGVLGLIGLQATAASQSSDAKYRSAAAELADQMINQIWVSNRTTSTYSTVLEPPFASTGAVYLAWLGNATTPGTVMGTLPGVTASSNQPTITFGSTLLPSGCATATNPPETCTLPVTVTMNWQGPHDTSAHTYTVNAQITLN